MKKWWHIVYITVILFLLFILLIYPQIKYSVKIKNGNVSQIEELSKYSPDPGYISSSKTAIMTAEAILSSEEYKMNVIFANVTYDENLDIWKVDCTTFPGFGAIVYISGNDGKIISISRGKF